MSLRFGSFEIFRPADAMGRGPSSGRNDIEIQMLDYVCENFYPHVKLKETKYWLFDKNLFAFKFANRFLKVTQMRREMPNTNSFSLK